MLRMLTVLILLGSLMAARAYDPFSETNSQAGALPAAAPTGRVVKVLPLFLDVHGHDSLSPSLFERDAYQALLRRETNAIFGVRVDVLWRARNPGDQKLTLRAELRGIGPEGYPRLTVLETPVTGGFFRQWASLTLNGQAWKNFGSLVAWRVTLWDGKRLLGEQKSFLW